MQIKQLSTNIYSVYGLPRWLSGKESTCQAGDMGLIPGLGRSPGERNSNPLQYSCLRNLMDRGYNPWGRRVRHDWATKQQSSVYNPMAVIKILSCLLDLYSVLLLIHSVRNYWALTSSQAHSDCCLSVGKMWTSHDSTGVTRPWPCLWSPEEGGAAWNTTFCRQSLLDLGLARGHSFPKLRVGTGSPGNKGQRQKRTLHLKASLAPWMSRVATFRNGMGRLEFWDLMNTRKCL